MLLHSLIACGLMQGAAPSHTAESIMARVAKNQDRAEHARSAFVYHQSVLIRLHRGHGKLAREEASEYTVTPTETGITKELTHFAGKYATRGKMIEYSTPGYHYKGLDADGDIARDLVHDLTDDPKSKDGIDASLFPLTTKEQAAYEFRLGGKENYRGADVYKITFSPKAGGDGSWAGEVLVHAAEYQPVLVTSTLAVKIPGAVKILLGTDIQHLGFKTAYEKFDEGLWFPVRYGGEFRLRVLFMYGRTVSLSLQNSGFARAKVDSTIMFGEVR